MIMTTKNTTFTQRIEQPAEPCLFIVEMSICMSVGFGIDSMVITFDRTVRAENPWTWLVMHTCIVSNLNACGDGASRKPTSRTSSLHSGVGVCRVIWRGIRRSFLSWRHPEGVQSHGKGMALGEVRAEISFAIGQSLSTESILFATLAQQRRAARGYLNSVDRRMDWRKADIM